MRLLAPLRHALFARFFVGQAMSQLGDFVFIVALTWHVINVIGDATALGGVLAAYGAAQLVLLLWGGVIVDRFPRRWVIVASDAMQALGALLLAALTLTGNAPLLVLYGVAAFFGAAQAFAMPALSAFVPETVPRDHLAPANSLYEGTRTLAAVGGPALGALVIALAGTGWAFAFNGATFLVSAALLATVRVPPAPAPVDDADAPPGGAGAFAEIRAGFRYTLGLPWLWITILVFAVVNAAEAGPRNVVLPVFVTNVFGTGPEGVGLIFSAQAAGALVGFVLMGQLPTPKRRGLFGYAATLASGVAVLALAFTTSLWQVLALSAAKGVTFAVFGLLWHLSIQDQVSARMRGRVYSIDMLGSFVLLPVSMFLSGVLADAFGARAVFLGGGLIVVACGLLGLVNRRASAFTAFERGEDDEAAPEDGRVPARAGGDG